MSFQIIGKDNFIETEAYVTAVDSFEAAEGSALNGQEDARKHLAPGACVAVKDYSTGVLNIYTAAKRWDKDRNGEIAVLRECFKNIFETVLEWDVESVTIPPFATVDYGFPGRLALSIAVSEIRDFLKEHDVDINLVAETGRDENINAMFLMSSAMTREIRRYLEETSALKGIDRYLSEKYIPVREPAGFAASSPMQMAPEPAGDRKHKHKSEDKADRRAKRGLFFTGAAKESTSQPAIRYDYDAFPSLTPEDVAPAFEHNEESDFQDAEAVAYEDEAICCDYFEDEEPSFAAATMLRAPSPTQAAVGRHTASLDDVIMKLGKSFMELVFYFADNKGITDVEVQKRANIDRKAFSKLKCGVTKNPSKPTALALAIALELSLDDTKDLLARAGYALSPCSRQDLIVQYFIEREVYDIYSINLALFEHGEQTLGSIAN